MDLLTDESFALEANLHGVTGSILGCPDAAFVGSEEENFYQWSPPPSSSSLYYSPSEPVVVSNQHLFTDDNSYAYPIAPEPDSKADSYANPWPIDDFSTSPPRDSLAGDSWLSEANDSALLERILNETEIFMAADSAPAAGASQSEILAEIYDECEALSPTQAASPQQPQSSAADHNFYGKSSDSAAEPTVKPPRRERKKVQNRTAAYRYRLKKRQEKEGRQAEISHLESHNRQLHAESEDLQREIGYLKGLMSEMIGKAKS